MVCAVGVGPTLFLLLGDRLRVFFLGLPHTLQLCLDPFWLFLPYSLPDCSAALSTVGTRTEALNWGQLSLLQGWWQAFDAVFGLLSVCSVPLICRCHMSCLVA